MSITAQSYIGLSTLLVKVDRPLLLTTVTLPNLTPNLLINGGQIPYSNVIVNSPQTFTLQLSQVVNDEIYISYAKPPAISVPQLRDEFNIPLETQRRTKVLILSSYDGSEPIPNTSSLAVNSFGTEPSVDDFILTFGEKEAILVSNIGDCDDSVTINKDRIQIAIQDALVWIDTYYSQAPLASRILVQSTRRRTALIIARYYLDSCLRRMDVKEDYERAIKELEVDSSQLPPVSQGSLPLGVFNFLGNGCC